MLREMGHNSAAGCDHPRRFSSPVLHDLVPPDQNGQVHDPEDLQSSLQVPDLSLDEYVLLHEDSH